MKKKRSLRILPIVSAAAVLLTACASQSGASSAAPAAEPSSSSSAQSVQNNADAKTIKVGIINVIPLFLQTDENGNPAGYDIDVLNALDEKLPQYKFDYEVMDFAALAVSLEAGQIDMADATFNRTEERAKKFLLPKQCYGYSLDSLLVKKDSTINDLDDCTGKTLVGEPTSIEYQYLVQWNKDHPDKQIKLSPVSGLTAADAYKLVDEGRADAFLFYRTSFDQIQKQLNLNVKLADAVVMKEEFVQMISKNEPELAQSVDKALQELVADGTLGKFSVKWFGQDVFTAGSSSAG